MVNSTASLTCKQKWNLWHYYGTAFPLIRYEKELLLAEIDGTIDQQAYNDNLVKVAEHAVALVKVTKLASNLGKESTKKLGIEVAENLSYILVNSFDKDGSVNDELVVEATGAFYDIIFSSIENSIDGALNPYSAVASLAPKAFNVIQTFMASWFISEKTERVNEYNIADGYLARYYQFKSNEEKTFKFFTNDTSSSFEKVIKAIAKSQGLENTLLFDDYNLDKVEGIVVHNRDSVVSTFTDISMGK